MSLGMFLFIALASIVIVWALVSLIRGFRDYARFQREMETFQKELDASNSKYWDISENMMLQRTSKNETE